MKINCFAARLKTLTEKNNKWKKINDLEIRTKKLSEDIFSGQFISSFKLTGLDFEEFKEYTFEDDSKYIDWKVSAKKNALYIKKFVEEKEISLVLVIDVSKSCFFGSNEKLKKEVIEELAVAIAFGCMKKNIRLSLILFDENVVEFIPFGRSKSHILNVIKKIFDFEYKKTPQTTCFHKPLKLINSLYKKKAIVIMLSDFQSDNFDNDLLFEKELNNVIMRHSFASIIITDPQEFLLPNIGLVEMQDPETGEVFIIDTNDPEINLKLKKKSKDITSFFRKKSINSVILDCSDDVHLRYIDV